MAGKLSEEEFKNWLTPSQAVNELDSEQRKPILWRRAILDGLLGGVIRAVAETTTFSGSRAKNKKPVPMGEIDPGAWKSVYADDNFWETSAFKIEQMFGAFDSLTTHIFGVRFDPAAVRKMRPSLPAPQTPVEAQEQPSVDDTVSKGPRVTDVHLKLWYDLYQQAYKGAADTEANAIASAQGMFPGKSVSRQIRELRGAQKRGRRPSDNNS